MKKVLYRKYSEAQLELLFRKDDYNLNDIDELIKSLEDIKKEGFKEVTISLEEVEIDDNCIVLESLSMIIKGHLAIVETDEDYNKRKEEENKMQLENEVKSQKELKQKELALLKTLKKKYER